MSEATPLLSIAKRGVLATGIAVISNLALLEVSQRLELVDPFGALAIPPITFLTILGAIAATVVYGAITRISPRPDYVFIRLAAVALLLSFIPNVVVLRFDAEATLGAVLLLMSMHVVVAVICVVTLTARNR